MRPPNLDPMAGDRARRITARSGAPVRIPDPTDPRCGQPLRTGEQGSAPQQILDPTDPGYGELPEREPAAPSASEPQRT